MKKILLATTILGMSAGYAAADITWGGSATAGIAQNGTSNGGDDQATVEDTVTPVHGDDVIEAYSSANLAMTMSGTSDSGLTFGATFDVTVGTTYTLGDEDGFADEGSFDAMPSVYVEGSFGKLTFSDDNIDSFDGDQESDGENDVQYDGTFGGFSVGVVADIDSSLMGAKVGYTIGALALSANYNQNDLVDDMWNVEGTYTMGAIAITAATDEASNASLKVAYANNGLSASAKYNTNGGSATDDPSVDVAVGYSANGLSVNASADDVSQANHTYQIWTVTASYDLGGGLSVEAGTNYTQDMMVGAKMSF
jgi:outer membrane protein OmpU